MLRKEILGTKIKTQSGLSKPITIAQPKDNSDYKSENFLDTDILLAKDIKQFVKGQEIDTSNLFKLNQGNTANKTTYIDFASAGAAFNNGGFALYKIINGSRKLATKLVTGTYPSTGDIGTRLVLMRFAKSEDGTITQSAESVTTPENIEFNNTSTDVPYVIVGDTAYQNSNRNIFGAIAYNKTGNKNYYASFAAMGKGTESQLNEDGVDVRNANSITDVTAEYTQIKDRASGDIFKVSSSALSFVKNNESQCFMNNDGEVGCECLKVYSYFSDDDPVPDHGMIIFDNNIQIISDKTLINFAKWNDEQNGTELYVDSIFPANNAVTHSPSISVYGNVGINHDGRNVSLGRNGIELTVDSQPISFLSIGEPNEDNYTETTVTADNLSARNGGLYITGNTKITGTLETTGRITANKGITINGGVVEYGQINVEGGIVRDGLGVGHIDKYQNKYLRCSDTEQQSSTKVYTTDGGIQETVLKSDYDALVARVAALEAKLAQ